MNGEEVRNKIFELVQNYYNEIHKEKNKFVPGVSTIPHAGKVYDEEEMKTLVDSCLDFWLTEGRFTEKFEKELSRFLGVKYSILTNSGSSANLLALTALTSSELKERRLKPGDEVITVACAFPTTVAPIVQNKAIPVFIDVDLQTQNIMSDRIEEAITEKTKVIFLAHTMGNPFNVNKVLEVAKKYDLWVIEDNCDALGSKYNEKYTGTIGDIGTLSFYPAHHITMGEGGALITNNEQLKKIIRSFRDWGRHCWCKPGHDNTCEKRFGWKLGSLPYGYDHKFIYSHLGYNLKVTDMQAAIGVAQLKKLPKFIEMRKQNWRKLYEGLKKYEKYFILPKPEENSNPSWFGFQITLRGNCGFSRNELTKYLEDNKIRTRLIFSGNIIRHPCFDGVEYKVVGDLKNTDYIMENSFFIGVYPGITDEMIKYMLNVFENFMKEKGE